MAAGSASFPKIPDEGVFARNARLGVPPAIVDKETIAALRDGSIEVVGAVESLDAHSVGLADGTRIDPQAIVCATGFRRELDKLVGHLGVLDEHRWPHATGAEPAAERLRFIGFVPRPSQIGYASKQALRAARAIARELR
ncbi:hypothetical protein [Aldersonia kunmingensis]|uniref:hypothetical protein n=1 Tax=Aldersonia kunmingensis TaxID=408066 RepID=UPI000AEB6D93|nr:hypothetical protein [Aldersonia kunmingensis]